LTIRSRCKTRRCPLRVTHFNPEGLSAERAGEIARGESAGIATVLQGAGEWGRYGVVGEQIAVAPIVEVEATERQQRERKVEETTEIVNEKRYIAFLCW